MRHPRRFETYLYILAAFVALLGLTDAIYLTVEHLTGRNVDCIASSGCETVLTSSYASIGRVPLAGFGAVAYFVAFSLGTLAAFGQARAGQLLLGLVGLMLERHAGFIFKPSCFTRSAISACCPRRSYYCFQESE